MCIEFTDIYPAYTSSGFACTNELPSAFANLIKKERMGNSLAIASAGEMSLFVLLPKTRGKLVCVDHSYRSLGVFYLKALMLKELGSIETKKILSSGNAKLVVEATSVFISKLPDGLRQAYEALVELNRDTRYSWYDHPFNSGSITGDLKARWSEVSVKVLDISRRKLDRILMLHGDVTDAFAYGPFTHAYLSNALEHNTRDGKQLNGTAEKLLKAFGSTTLITTSSYGRLAPHQWTTVSTVYKQGTTPYWNYNILKPSVPITRQQEVATVSASI